MTPWVRKLALTGHVTASVGWIGAIAAFLALSIIGITSDDPATVRAVYLVMEPAARAVLVPLSLASLLTGVIQSLATPWGLFRHYWVVVKLAINVFSVVILMIYMKTFRAMAVTAADPGSELAAVRNPSPVVHAILALAILLVATVLAIYKPRGLTPYGSRKQEEDRAGNPASSSF
jgi:hypothetical protein